MRKALLSLIAFCALFLLFHSQAMAVPITIDITVTGTLTGKAIGSDDVGYVVSTLDLPGDQLVETQEILAKDGPYQNLTVNISQSWSGDLPLCGPFQFDWHLDAGGYMDSWPQIPPFISPEIDWNVTGQLTITGPIEWLDREYYADAMITYLNAYPPFSQPALTDSDSDSNSAYAALTLDSMSLDGWAQTGDLTGTAGTLYHLPDTCWTSVHATAGIRGEFHPVPEPASMLLLGSGLLGLGGLRRKFKK